MWVSIWYNKDMDYLLDYCSLPRLFLMFERGVELEKFRAAKIAQYVWGKPDPEPERDGVDLETKNKVYGSGNVSR